MSDVCIFLLVLTSLTGRTDVYLFAVKLFRTDMRKSTFLPMRAWYLSQLANHVLGNLYVRISLTQNVVGARE